MAASLLANGVSDICIGKPALRSLFLSTTVGEALLALERSKEPSLSVWSCQCSNLNNKKENKFSFLRSKIDGCKCIGKICMMVVICYLSKEENLKDPLAALQQPLSVVFDKDFDFLVRHLEPHASLLEAIDLALEGAQNLVVPIHSPFTIKKLIQKPSSFIFHNTREYCWITQEDIIRHLLNSIGLFSPIINHHVDALNLVDSQSTFAVCFDDPASSVLPLLSQAVVRQVSVAILDLNGRLIGEISPTALNCCDKSVAAAIATLSAGDLMACVDCGGLPEDMVQLVKRRLEERNLSGALELLEDDSRTSSAMSCSSSSSNSSSSDDEFGLNRSSIVGRYSTKVLRRAETIVCHPWSSMMAVMIQTLSYRVSYAWVVKEDGTLIGVVTFTGMMKVFRERLKSML